MRAPAQSARIRARACRGSILVAVLALASTWAAAGQLDGSIEANATRSNLENEDRAGNRIEQSVDSLLQRYTLNFTHRFYPNFQIRLFGLFERQDDTTDLAGLRFDSTRKRFLPIGELTLRTGIWFGELAYDRRADQSRSAGVSSTLTQERYRGTVGWVPEALPRVRLELSRRNVWDQGRRGINVTQDRAQLFGDYQPNEKVGLYYRGSLERNMDRVRDSEIDNHFESGRVSYGDTWRSGRLIFNTDYNINWRETKTVKAGGGEVVFPVVPTAGLSAIDDTPELGPLAANPALIDGNLAAATGIDLGLPPPGGETRPRNFGLDLGVPTELNDLLVWIDRELVPDIAAAFSWRVYTSPDNLVWTLVQSFPSAPFGPFENRFELRLSGVTTRYVKVVVSPLTASVPNASTWPTIQITELQPQVVRSAADLATKTETTSQILNANFRARLLEKIAFFYDLGYTATARTNAPTLWTLSNGLAVNHPISPILFGAANVSREDRQEIGGRRIAYLFAGSLTASPLETLRLSVAVNEQNELGAGARDTAAVVLSGSADLYRGVSLTLAAGKSRVQTDPNGLSKTDDYTGSLALVPHPAFTVNVTYQYRAVDTRLPEGTFVQAEILRAGEVGAVWRPVRSLYLFGSYRREETSVGITRTLRNWSGSWTPFPDGTFHFNVFYNETYRTETSETQQTLVPTLRWDITSRMFVDLSWQLLKTDSVLGRSRDEIGSVTFRWTF